MGVRRNFSKGGNVEMLLILFRLLTNRGGARHFHLGGPLEGPVLQQGELSMVCVGLSERDLILGGQWHPLAPPLLTNANGRSQNAFTFCTPLVCTG